MPMTNSEEHLHGGHTELADYLQSHKDALIHEWIDKVRNDPDVPSGLLTQPELIDHVPKVIDSIIHALRQYTSETTFAQVREIASRHTVLRWVQGYSLHAVLREIALLRAEFIQSLRVFEDEHEYLSSTARLFTSTTIHSTLDNFATDAAEMFKLKAKARKDEV
jgi:hypothetical protein